MELSVMEQRYQAVLAVVQDGWKVVEVAERLGVSRQSIHNWIARYEHGGLASLTDRSRRPHSCPHQTSAEVEALICELRGEHPGWRPRRIAHQLGRGGIDRDCPRSLEHLPLPEAPWPDRAASSPPTSRGSTGGNGSVPCSCGRWT
ncbi:MAG TPA: leucine zipper domain-containing protein [Actinomycetota bacterium]